MVSNATVIKMLFLVANCLGMTSLVLLLAWYLQFRGGFTYWYDTQHLKQLFSWHPLLITIGLVLINGEGTSTRLEPDTTGMIKHEINFSHAGVPGHGAASVDQVAARHLAGTRLHFDCTWYPRGDRQA